jgi:hypothetical protein
MSTYKAPLDDLRFALYDVLGAERCSPAWASPTSTANWSMPCWTKPRASPKPCWPRRQGCKYDKASGA